MQLPTSPEATQEVEKTPFIVPRSSLTTWSLPADNKILPNVRFALRDRVAMDDTQVQFFSGNNYLSADLNAQTFSLNETSTLDELLAFDGFTSGQLESLPNFSVVSSGNEEPESAAWCTWAGGSVSISVVTENPVSGLDSNLLAVLQMERPHAQHNANIVVQSLRSFPTMMLRRETFPWFIHPHSQVLSKSTQALPEALSTCMSIAQLFASRRPETKHFLWGTIKVEHRRFLSEVRALHAPSFSS
jgi:hypothetical protein